MTYFSYFTPDELAAEAKGYGRIFNDYIDLPDPIRLSAEEYGKMCAWALPYLQRRFEVQGAVSWHMEQWGVQIERSYCMGGNSISCRTTCKCDDADMLAQMRVNYPEMIEFLSDRIGWWHLHPGYYGRCSLSVGDVEEVRTVLRNCKAEDATILELLIYGDPVNFTFDIAGYFVGIDNVWRLPVEVR